MSHQVEGDREMNQEADDIASKMIGILVEKFKEREGRDPDQEEMEQLLEELTEERVAEMLGMEVKQNDQEEDEEDVVTTGEKGLSSSSVQPVESVSNETSSNVVNEEEPSEEANKIATGILDILVEKFKEKTGKDPCVEDVAKMLEEMTEERVAELLNGNVMESNDAISPKRKTTTSDNSDSEDNKKVKVC